MTAIVSLPGVDVATNPRAPSIAKIVEPEEIQSKTGACCSLLNSCTIGICNVDCNIEKQTSSSAELGCHLQAWLICTHRTAWAQVILISFLDTLCRRHCTRS